MRVYYVTTDTDSGTHTDIFLHADHWMETVIGWYLLYNPEGKAKKQISIAQEAHGRGDIKEFCNALNQIRNDDDSYFGIDTIVWDWEEIDVSIYARVEGGVLTGISSNVSGIEVNVFDVDNEKEDEVNFHIRNEQWEGLMNDLIGIY